MKMIISTVLAAFVGVALAAQPPAVTAPADLLVVNGKVYTADGRGTFAQAVAVRGNTIAAVGTTQDLERMRGPCATPATGSPATRPQTRPLRRRRRTASKAPPIPKGWAPHSADCRPSHRQR